MVAHQLDNDPDVLVEILDRDDPHDVGSILRVWISTSWIREDQAGVGLRELKANKSDVDPCEGSGPRKGPLTRTLSRSRVLMAVPLKYTTWVKFLLNRASSSKSGLLLEDIMKVK